MLTTKKSGFTIFTACAMALILGGCSSTTSLSSNYGSSSDSSYQSDSSSTASDSSGSSSSDSNNDSSYAADSTGDSSYAADSDSSSSSSDSDSSGVWLPDPGTLLNVDGEYYSTITEENGITYDYYTYDFTATYLAVSNFIVTYGEALRDMDYTLKSLTPTSDYELKYMSYTKDGECAEIGVFNTGSYADTSTIDDETILQWRVVLAVPVTMSFTLGSAVPGTINGETKCVGCNGTGNCSGCGGTGRVNYGDGYETCVNCDGTGICNICDGAGLY